MRSNVGRRVRRREVAGPEQPLEGVLGLAPAPPTALAFPAAGAVRQIARGLRPFGPDAVQHRHRGWARLAGEDLEPAVAALAAVRPRHAPAQQRLQGERQQGALMRPIFEELALPPRPPGGASSSPRS